MHELSIAAAVVDAVIAHLPSPQARVEQVRVRIGALAGVLPDALDFAYDVAVAGTPLEGSRLVLEIAPIIVTCAVCGPQEITDRRDFRCPVCGQVAGRVVGGKEMEIVDIEAADAPADAGVAGAVPADTVPTDTVPAGTSAADIAPAAPIRTREREIREGVLLKNDLLAQGLRSRYAAAGLRVSNWVSSPGSGKTTLLEALLTQAVERGVRAAALVGDCATDHDAQRLARSGAAVRQIVTDGGCHLESQLVSAHLEGWDLDQLDLLVIENVGNLVCPASYDLGEELRLVLFSTTEGEDKPLKYPAMFATAHVVVITKVDLADAVEWDREQALAAVRRVNPDVRIIETSARRGIGIEPLLDLLLREPVPV